MTKRGTTPLHDKWHRRVEGQIRCCMKAHPEWFTDNAQQRAVMLNSLSKRIVGEIIADRGVGDDTD